MMNDLVAIVAKDELSYQATPEPNLQNPFMRNYRSLSLILISAELLNYHNLVHTLRTCCNRNS